MSRLHDGESSSRRLRGFKKRGKQAIGKSRGGLTTKIHTLAASPRFAINFSLSSGSANDSEQGMRLLFFTPPGKRKQFLLMDRAYSGKRMRMTAVELGYEPVVAPKRNYKEQWDYDEDLYKRRN